MGGDQVPDGDGISPTLEVAKSALANSCGALFIFGSDLLRNARRPELMCKHVRRLQRTSDLQDFLFPSRRQLGMTVTQFSLRSFLVFGFINDDNSFLPNMLARRQQR
jgi:hypothetical protein